MAPSPARDAYAVLGVSPAADDEAILAAHRELARRYHPDVAGDDATRLMMDINAAFDRLRTPERRAAYDRELEGIDPSRAAIARTRRIKRQDGGSGAQGSGGASASGGGGDASARTIHPEHDGTGGAGRPPGRPSGSVLAFGRHVGWSMGEIARVDPGYLVWLEDRAEGRPYLAEIDQTLRRVGYRKDPPSTKGRR